MPFKTPIYIIRTYVTGCLIYPRAGPTVFTSPCFGDRGCIKTPQETGTWVTETATYLDAMSDTITGPWARGDTSHFSQWQTISNKKVMKSCRGAELVNGRARMLTWTCDCRSNILVAVRAVSLQWPNLQM